jgi:hypothetical protein
MVKVGVISGRIFEIIVVNEKVAQIVLNKKDNKGKVIPITISVVGFWKDKIMNLKQKDKIRGNLYMKSNLYNGKYYTDVQFKEIDLIEPAPIKMGTTTLFVDKETGEILTTL